MRLAVSFGWAGPSVLLLTACATGGSSTSADAVDRACSVSDCFFERDVRDFEVIDNSTLVVFVGNQRCAFRVELDGTFCDMNMAPNLFFRSSRRNVDMDRTYGSNRICSFDRSIGVDGGVFTERFDQPPDAFGGRRSQCQIRSVASITDDQLVELYVARGVVAPPPPIGPGRIEVNQEAATESPPAETSDDAPPGGEANQSTPPQSAPRADAAPTGQRSDRS